MSRRQVLHAHIAFMRARACVLRQGDEAAKERASELELAADRIETELEKVEAEVTQ